MPREDHGKGKKRTKLCCALRFGEIRYCHCNMQFVVDCFFGFDGFFFKFFKTFLSTTYRNFNSDETIDSIRSIYISKYSKHQKIVYIRFEINTEFYFEQNFLRRWIRNECFTNQPFSCVSSISRFLTPFFLCLKIENLTQNRHGENSNFPRSQN